MTERKRVSLSLDLDDRDSQPSKETVPVKTVKSRITKDAETSGFTSRKPTKPKVDGRTLRKTDRTTQLNIGISPRTKDRFWQAASDHGHRVGGEFLEYLLDLADKDQRKSR